MKFVSTAWGCSYIGVKENQARLLTPIGRLMLVGTGSEEHKQLGTEDEQVQESQGRGRWPCSEHCSDAVPRLQHNAVSHRETWS